MTRADVFCSVASYNDPDTERTLRTMLDGAELRLRIAVVLQTDDADLAGRIAALPVDLVHLPLAAARGPCWARAVAEDMFDGESWCYHCDAHMRFEPGWDAELVGQAEALPGKPILTAYQQDVRDQSEGQACVMDVDTFGTHGIRWRAHIWSLDAFGGRPVPARGLSGHSVFAPGRWVEEVPYDPRIFFAGEETSLALRAFTHGYDLYHPCATICRHRYERAPGTTYWEHRADWSKRDERSRQRLAQLYGWERSAMVLGAYGLGRARTLTEYEAWAGISFARRAALPDATWRETL